MIFRIYLSTFEKLLNLKHKYSREANNNYTCKTHNFAKIIVLHFEKAHGKVGAGGGYLLRGFPSSLNACRLGSSKP